jgi:hypothetical protein
VKITYWYSNGSLNAINNFCVHNQDKSISVKLISRSELLKGALYIRCTGSLNAEGLSLLLTRVANHPAFYCLDDIQSLRMGSIPHGENA